MVKKIHNFGFPCVSISIWIIFEIKIHLKRVTTSYMNVVSSLVWKIIWHIRDLLHVWYLYTKEMFLNHNIYILSLLEKIEKAESESVTCDISRWMYGFQKLVKRNRTLVKTLSTIEEEVGRGYNTEIHAKQFKAKFSLSLCCILPYTSITVDSCKGLWIKYICRTSSK